MRPDTFVPASAAPPAFVGCRPCAGVAAVRIGRKQGGGRILLCATRWCGHGPLTCVPRPRGAQSAVKVAVRAFIAPACGARNVCVIRASVRCVAAVCLRACFTLTCTLSENPSVFSRVVWSQTTVCGSACGSGRRVTCDV
ncbi:hypothetical protein, conserved in T. vivax [Trypanosoma vivax Y486]|uniref:Uncharacterized protein n=1 Tax=Trypanosoma vivax (strain Y486) TaxID=1055687 RepID=F9WVK9_TRYVY|nr:hypothetical protein, conserved in T. vivax [Trypanosoma vivax Y486]|eukprot:CCD21617.1 hypothetical protein, conserved in T. vivax [Trypanosoma vivax Y486]